MTWHHKAVSDFRIVARLAGLDLREDAIGVENLPAPHVPPPRLPVGKIAVYVFSRGPYVLKVGKAGPKSEARYTYQHYSARSAPSTLAKSILSDREELALSQLDENNIGKWIRENTDRVNFLLDESFGIPALTLLEAFLQCRLEPRYEGYKSQRL